VVSRRAGQKPDPAAALVVPNRPWALTANFVMARTRGAVHSGSATLIEKDA